jgi:hypothetical protein
VFERLVKIAMVSVEDLLRLIVAVNVEEMIPHVSLLYL